MAEKNANFVVVMSELQFALVERFSAHFQLVLVGLGIPKLIPAIEELFQPGEALFNVFKDELGLHGPSFRLSNGDGAFGPESPQARSIAVGLFPDGKFALGSGPEFLPVEVDSEFEALLEGMIQHAAENFEDDDEDSAKGGLAFVGVIYPKEEGHQRVADTLEGALSRVGQLHRRDEVETVTLTSLVGDQDWEMKFWVAFQVAVD